MTISEASQVVGLSADTLRYYERIGLIPTVKRSKSGIREYEDKNIAWLNFAKCMRTAGMPIESIIEYVTLFKEGASTRTARKDLLIEQRKVLLEKKKELDETLKTIDHKIYRYENNMITNEENMEW